MKEVFLLPTTEGLSPLLPKQLERRSLPAEEWSFRDYLEQAKSASKKPLTKEFECQPSRVQEEEPNPLPLSGETEPEVEIDEPKSLSVSLEDVQSSLVQAVVLEALPAVVIQAGQGLETSLNEENLGQLQEEQSFAGIGEMADSALPSATDRLVLESLNQNTGVSKTSQNRTTEKAFVHLVRTTDETPKFPQEVRTSGEGALQPKESIKLDYAPAGGTDGDETPVSSKRVIETMKSAGMNVTEVATEKSQGMPSSSAQDRASVKSVVADLSKTGDPEAKPQAVKEGAKLEGAQASGPPLNAASAKPIEPARLAEAHRPEVVQQVARELEIFGKFGQTSLRIQLYPEQLGRIEVRLTSKADGVQIVLHADNASTAFLLERDLNYLRESLVQAGVNLSGLTVGHGQAQNRSNLAQSEFQSPNHNAGKLGDAEQRDLPSENFPWHGWRDSSSTVDYRI